MPGEEPDALVATVGRAAVSIERVEVDAWDPHRGVDLPVWARTVRAHRPQREVEVSVTRGRRTRNEREHARCDQRDPGQTGYAGTASRSISGAYMPVRAALFIFARW